MWHSKIVTVRDQKTSMCKPKDLHLSFFPVVLFRKLWPDSILRKKMQNCIHIHIILQVFSFHLFLVLEVSTIGLTLENPTNHLFENSIDEGTKLFWIQTLTLTLAPRQVWGPITAGPSDKSGPAVGQQSLHRLWDGPSNDELPGAVWGRAGEGEDGRAAPSPRLCLRHQSQSQDCDAHQAFQRRDPPLFYLRGTRERIWNLHLQGNGHVSLFFILD